MSPVTKKQKQAEKAIKKVESSEESEESEEEEVVVKKAPVKKAPVKKAPVKDDSSDESSDEVNTKRKPSKEAKKAPAKKAVAKKAESSEEESSDEEPVKKAPAKKASPAKKAAAKKVESSDEESEVEEEKPASKVASRKSSRKSSKKDDGKVVGKTLGEYELFVGGLSYQATKEDIEAYFNEIVTVINVNLLMGDRGSKGLAFVKVGSKEEMEACVAATGSEFMGRRINIEQAKKREERPPRGSQAFSKPPNANSGVAGTSCSIFVGNLSYNTDENSLKVAFEGCGEILSARVAKNPEGRSRGFGHVDFSTPEAAEKALGQNGADVDGRAVRIDLSQGKQNKPAGGFGGGNRSYGGADNSARKGNINGFEGKKKRL